MESENTEIVEQTPVTEVQGNKAHIAEASEGAPEAVAVSSDDEGDTTSEKSLDEPKSPESTEEVVVSRASPALLQAILLASGEPVSFVKLQEIMRCSRPEVLSALESLREHCSSDFSGVEIVAVGERLQLRTKVAFAEPVRELLAVKPRKLSQAALETLSVVAYQQPIVKSEIDKIRGVDVAPTLKTLLERKIIKIIGYQASVGQPALYGTTDDFLRIFGLSSLAELPALRDLRALAKEPGESGEGESIEESLNEAGEESEAVAPSVGSDEAVVLAEVANNDEPSISASDTGVSNQQSEVGNT